MIALDESWVRRRGEELLEAGTKEERRQIVEAILHIIAGDLAFIEGEGPPLGVIDEDSTHHDN